jgi:hypothetical protein
MEFAFAYYLPAGILRYFRRQPSEKNITGISMAWMVGVTGIEPVTPTMST